MCSAGGEEFCGNLAHTAGKSQTNQYQTWAGLMFKKRSIYIALSALLLTLGWCIYRYFNPQPIEVVVSSTTTFISEPLGKDGRIDYTSALNQHASRNVTPENNAAIPLWQLNHQPVEAAVQQAYFQQLGAEAPDTTEPEWVQLIPQERIGQLSSTEINELLNQHTQAFSRPWSEQEFPGIARYLAANEANLVKATEASKLPCYFWPVVRESGQLFMSMQLPAMLGVREVARTLTARAMLRLGMQDYDAAWDDLLAALRLGRLATQGMLLETLNGISIQGIALAGMRQYLKQAPLDQETSLARIAELTHIQQAKPLVNAIDFDERLSTLDTLSHICGGNLEAWLTEDESRDAKLKRAHADVNAALTVCNDWFDEYVRIARIADPTQRLASHEQFLQTFEADYLVVQASTGTLGRLLVTNAYRAAVGQATAMELLAFQFHSLAVALAAEARVDQAMDLLLIGFKLAAFQAQHGNYPATLAELSQGDSTAIPKDRFSGKELIYQPQNGGYLLCWRTIGNKQCGSLGPRINIPKSPTGSPAAKLNWPKPSKLASDHDIQGFLSPDLPAFRVHKSFW